MSESQPESLPSQHGEAMLGATSKQQDQSQVSSWAGRLTEQGLDQLPKDQQELLSQLSGIRDALAILKRFQLPVSITEQELEARLEEIRRQPTEADKRWPLDVPEEIGEHISLGNDRPNLSTKLSVGRAYSLTAGQRDTLRDKYGFTPTKLVEVHEVALFPGTKLIKCVTLRSSEHVPSTRRHVRCTIENWGQFCDQAKQRDAERAEARELLKEDVLSQPESDVTSLAKSASAKSKKSPTKSFQQLVDEYAV